jgi:hypothetical protein
MIKGGSSSQLFLASVAVSQEYEVGQLQYCPWVVVSCPSSVVIFFIATKGCSYMTDIDKVISVGASSACDKRM